MCDTDCELFTVLGLALNTLLVSPVEVLRALRTYLSPASPWLHAHAAHSPGPHGSPPGLSVPVSLVLKQGWPPAPHSLAQPRHGDTWQKASTASRWSWCYIAWLMLWWERLVTSLVFCLCRSPFRYCGYTEVSELAASLTWLVRSIFIRTLTVAKKEMGLVKQSASPGSQEEATTSSQNANFSHKLQS